MRTTLVIDDDVLDASKAIAREQGRTVGEVVSDIARNSLHAHRAVAETRNGISLSPRKPGVIVTMEVVNALRDELP